MFGASTALAQGNDSQGNDNAAAAASNGQDASSSSRATTDEDTSSPSQGDAHRSDQAKASTSEHANSSSDDSSSDESSNDTSSATENTTASTSASDHQTEGTAGTAGTPPAEQPNSTADDNDSGANGQCSDDDSGDVGVYCGTTRDHKSLNGNGNGAAVGKPCAGCVGKADNKNPPGQMPNAAEDGNSGYECDTNNGIGKTNPAHTGCVAPSGGEECVPSEANHQCGEGEECVPSEANHQCGEDSVTPPKDEETPPKDNVTPPKGAEETPPVVAPRPPTVKGVETVAQPPAAVQQNVTPPTAVQPSAGVLPNTGTPAFVGLLALVGLAFLGLGAVAMRSRRGTES